MSDSAQLPPGQPFYPLNDMALLLALRVQKPGEDLRPTVDKVRKRLLYAVAKDELHVTGPLQFFLAAQVFAWARKKWPGTFSDIAVKHDAHASDTLNLDARIKNWHYPGDLGECHKLLRSLYDDLELLEEELASATREIRQLRPLAEKYEEIRRRNRRSAKLPRKNV